MAATGAQPELELMPVPPTASEQNMPPDEAEEAYAVDPRLHRRTLAKLDCLLLPFLALFFLFNALDKANVGQNHPPRNAESANFTEDVGLEKSDINTAVALFFAFFVTLQPPKALSLEGNMAVSKVELQVKGAFGLIADMVTAGFYPVTVTYLSLFYTRFEFGRRLSLFYGQAAVGGALGGIISWAVFSRFHNDGPPGDAGWRPWQVLFLIEGSMTIAIAIVGYFVLPHNVETAWFLTPEERQYASTRVLQDRNIQNVSASSTHEAHDYADEDYDDEESRDLLNPAKAPATSRDHASLDDRGVTPADIFSAVFNTKIWHLLACNILSAIPVYAFSVFLPLVLAPLTKKSNPALINLLTAPPHICGAIVLFCFAWYSDLHRIRLIPVLYGLAIMVAGLTIVVALPVSWAIPRYLALNLLLSGTYVASPLTVAWISGNTPSPGKRAVLLGINGWGNLAGIIAAMLYRPSYAESGYIVPFWWTLISVALSAIGYLVFLRRLRNENATRKRILNEWSEDAVEMERLEGKGPRPREHRLIRRVVEFSRSSKLDSLANWLEDATERGRQGDERVTFVYGL
ncbi:hypothetical protein SNOG_14785 [Parastagonospora nodorum SN15]|uniref:Major facilitator superfamily (MFS) profile domain-containing protein n=1 Tax=Phaeosphaeria nodorum (strain SN15 / ATCC MYA-4574 / FGSC 10173) TaxID=321614 RepID=Q0U0T0_PHANO|nr:hypothetical protein SNOG_14785 [Parastagonospora nodorum SN15]EAT77977.2 hypothetical protein SNOG_14785 [Parastagonospora nodorum SN15]